MDTADRIYLAEEQTFEHGHVYHCSLFLTFESIVRIGVTPFAWHWQIPQHMSRSVACKTHKDALLRSSQKVK